MFIKKELLEVWTIGIYKLIFQEGEFKFFPDAITPNPILSAKHVKDHKCSFVADPFLIFDKGIYYLFFEALNAKGEIGVAKSPDCKKWQYEKIILEEPFHLSYPLVFSHGSKYYMLPECYQSNSIRLYESTNFPYEWRFVKTMLEGKDFVDPTIIYSKERFWLFVSDVSNGNLFLHFADSIEGPWTEHPQSPIIKNNVNIARPGGSVISVGNKLIRIAQDDSKTYGYAVRGFEITTLNINAYSEQELSQGPLLQASGHGWNKDGMHHLSLSPTGPNEWIAAVDGKLFRNQYKVCGWTMPSLINRILDKIIK